MDNASRKRLRRKTRRRVPWNPVPETVLYAGTSIVLYKDRSHIAQRKYNKISKNNMGRGQSVLIVANICRMKLKRAMADMLPVELNNHNSLI